MKKTYISVVGMLTILVMLVVADTVTIATDTVAVDIVVATVATNTTFTTELDITAINYNLKDNEVFVLVEYINNSNVVSKGFVLITEPDEDYYLVSYKHDLMTEQINIPAPRVFLDAEGYQAGKDTMSTLAASIGQLIAIATATPTNSPPEE